MLRVLFTLHTIEVLSMGREMEKAVNFIISLRLLAQTYLAHVLFSQCLRSSTLLATHQCRLHTILTMLQ